MTRRRRGRRRGGRFHAVLVFLRTVRDAFRGGEPRRELKPRKAAPFCTVCGERTRPWDPDDEQRHQHDQRDAQQQ